jgi:diguanylate cyclase (GGDEF)-like protein
MKQKTIALLEMLSLVYEDMDIDAIEERFISLVTEFFDFDRVGLLFVKHKEGVLQGKLCSGFDPGTISSLKIPFSENSVLTKPLISGFPVWNVGKGDDPIANKIGLNYFAVIPIVNRKRISCWQLTGCSEQECPAYGNKWLRCWLVPNTKCNNGMQRTGADKMQVCLECPVFSKQKNGDAVEGVILIDQVELIEEETIALLSIIAHAVGSAINNTKVFSNVLREAIHDDLTGLHNRRYFNERLIDEVDRANRYNSPLSMVMIDVDHFKTINDTYGHPVGDRVLQWLAAIVRDKVRHSDIVARYGGEEFAILLLNANTDQAGSVAEKIRQIIASTSPPFEKELHLTVSLGVSALQQGATSFEEMIEKSDKALYQAKSQGRNQVVVM